MPRRTYLLTGATGFLGSHLMAALLERGDRLVLLGRPSGTKSLALRISALLHWFGLEHRNAQVETVETDFLKPCCGLAAKSYQALCSKRAVFIHCASDTRFSESCRQESTAANVKSLKEILDLARNAKAEHLHYISTAYASGIGSNFCPEAPVESQRFSNVYEETKAQAEKEVAARCRRDAIPYTIIRPSIVYGDSRSGRANRFNALYNHVKSLYFIREIYLNDLEKHDGKKSRDCGIHLDDEGILNLPLRVTLTQHGYLNLIPVDYFVSVTLAVLDQAENGSIFHVTSDAPKTVAELAVYCEIFLKMKGIRIVYGNDANEPAWNPPEALFNRFIEPYRHYLSDPRIFERTNTNRVTAGMMPPEFSYEVFQRCMEYAVSVNWGKDNG